MTPTWTGEDLRRPIRLARERAREQRRAVLLALSRAIAAPGDVLDWLQREPGKRDDRFLWQQPAEGFAIAAIGATRVLNAGGTDRFDTIRDACDTLFRDAVIAGDAGPLFVGGFAFAPEPAHEGGWCGFPPARLVLPRLCVVQRGTQATLTVAVMINERDDLDAVRSRILADLARLGSQASVPHATGSDAGPASYEACAQSLPLWQQAVTDTVADIAGGDIEKLVLARSCSLRSSRAFDCARALRRLRQAYPECTTFWVGTRHGDFLGATPESLVRLQGITVNTVAMAGTIARGTSPAADRALGRRLQDSDKERREHAVVVDTIAKALGPLCATLDVPAEPDLLPLENLQHLVSPISGTLRRPASVLELVERLHPSPAVAGHPRAAALALLRRREGLERGWYAGAIGWMDAQQQGEFVVGIRSALVRECEASLFAGAGIVAGSEPQAELAETRLKLQPLLSALMEL